MNMTVALRLLGEIMEWDDEKATTEYHWLRFMARFKYDGYRDFVAGARFLESLAAWLRRFDPVHRETAYALLKEHLIYIGPAEMRRLIESLYPDTVYPWLVREVSRRTGVPAWAVADTPASAEALRELRRRTLFVGLSEGAHPDGIRHANPGILSNEQIIVSHQMGDEKWDDVVKELRKSLGDEALFARAYLVDDFTASGTTLLRRNGARWAGKLKKFLDGVRDREARGPEFKIFEDGWTIGVHHYLATEQAAARAGELFEQFRAEESVGGYGGVDFTYGYLLPESSRLPVEDGPLRDLIDASYDPAIETTHNAAGGGGTDIRFGYKECALAVVLEHNTPNNSLPILWAESDNTNDNFMRPLFRRRQRHT